MLPWIIALALILALVGYILVDYKTKGLERKALRALHAENKQLQRYIDQHIQQKKPDTAFTATFEAAGIDSIESTLHQMISRAQSEIVIVSPWIKEAAWLRIRDRIAKFCRNGGSFKVFIRGSAEDFYSGACDRSVVEEIMRFGGVVTCIPQLHAKVYLIDRHEALISSANFTRSGLDLGYEAGVWSCNPVIVQKVYRFVEKLAS